ncbi:MAG: hypothetical protein HFH38_11480 [Lachnospiraceae bacterium]|nr:hypothetical protein [Lachnospiraceae bacterium]
MADNSGASLAQVKSSAKGGLGVKAFLDVLASLSDSFTVALHRLAKGIPRTELRPLPA